MPDRAAQAHTSLIHGAFEHHGTHRQPGSRRCLADGRGGSAFLVSRVLLGDALIPAPVVPGNPSHHPLRVAVGDLGEKAIRGAPSQHRYHSPAATHADLSIVAGDEVKIA